MTKIKAGQRLGIAVAIEAEVCFIPSKYNHWNRDTLFQTQVLSKLVICYDFII